MSSNCEKNKLCEDDELKLQKEEYIGTDLKVNGYYYGDINENSNMPFANIYYLYKNGVFFTSEASDLDDARSGKINVDIENNFGKKIKAAWGVFQIKGKVLEIERWHSKTNGCESTIYEKCEILNDTTFVIIYREYRDKGKIDKAENPNSLFYFRHLIQKPDSTNSFI